MPPKLNSGFGKSTYLNLRHHYIGTYFPGDAYQGLDNLVAYQQEDILPFHDQELRASYGEVWEKTSKFSHDLWLLYSIDESGRATWRPSGNGSVSHERYRQIRSEVAKLDTLATELADSWENFLRVAKTQLKGNSVGIISYQKNKRIQ